MANWESISANKKCAALFIIVMMEYHFARGKKACKYF